MLPQQRLLQAVEAMLLLLLLQLLRRAAEALVLLLLLLLRAADAIMLMLLGAAEAMLLEAAQDVAAFAGLFETRSVVRGSTGGTISKKTGQLSQHGTGKGLGGAGGSMTCKACIIVKCRLTSISQVVTDDRHRLCGIVRQGQSPWSRATNQMPLLQVPGLPAGYKQQWEVKASSDDTHGQITNWDFHKISMCPHKQLLR